MVELEEVEFVDNEGMGTLGMEFFLKISLLYVVVRWCGLGGLLVGKGGGEDVGNGGGKEETLSLLLDKIEGTLVVLVGAPLVVLLFK